MNQQCLPMSLEDLIPEHHVVRVINEYVERMDIEPLEEVKQLNGKVPKTIIADAGYGSEENYLYLHSNNHDPYSKSLINQPYQLSPL